MQLPELPPPVSSALIVSPQMAQYRVLSANYEPGCAMHSPDQMRAYGQACANAALERAAVICASANNYDNPMTSSDVVDAIRAEIASKTQNLPEPKPGDEAGEPADTCEVFRVGSARGR